jgi:hypothetical protein
MHPRVANHYALHQYFRDPASMPIVVGIGTASGIVALVALLAAHFARGGERRRAALVRLADVVAALWLAGTLSTIVFDQQSSFPIFPWYWYEAFLVLLIGPGIVIAALLPALRMPAVSRRAIFTVTAGALAIGAIVGIALRVDANGSENFYTENAEAAIALNHLLPKDAVVAMGDRAGIIGYFLDRPVVQLEGIVNSNEFLDAVKHDRVHAFLRRERVTYYAKSSKRADHLLLELDGGPDAGALECGTRYEPFFGGNDDKVVFTVCKHNIVYTLPLAHGEQFVIWKYVGGPRNFHVPG